MDLGIKGKWALVGGASKGLGFGCAQSLAREGANVVIVARGAEALDKTRAELAAKGVKVHAASCDVGNAANLNAFLEGAHQALGRIDVLINNAVYQDREVNAMLLDLDDDALQRSLLGNVVAPFHMAKKVLPHMIARGAGKIINVGSGAGQFDPPLPANQGGWGFAYGASKAGMGRLAGCINREWGHKGIVAFSVNPGFVNTEAAQATMAATIQASPGTHCTCPRRSHWPLTTTWKTPAMATATPSACRHENRSPSQSTAPSAISTGEAA